VNSERLAHCGLALYAPSTNRSRDRWRPHTVLELADAVCDGTGLAPRVLGGGRLGDVRHIVASAERAAARLGFGAEEPFTGATLAG
jgi:nucleoside-diphosphate-sugar epimerase